MTRQRKLTVAAIAATLFIGVFLSVQMREQQMVETGEQTIIGRWQKSEQSECRVVYPSEIEFLKAGIYKSPKGVNEGAIWHGGDWQQHGSEKLSIQSANDAMLQYRISSQTPSTLILVDDAGCRIHYQKMP